MTVDALQYGEGVVRARIRAARQQAVEIERVPSAPAFRLEALDIETGGWTGP